MPSGWSMIPRENGQQVVEYGLTVGLIGIVVLAVLIALGPHLNHIFEHSVSADTHGDAQKASSEAFYDRSP